MAAGLHGSARTTPRVRAELQAAKAPARALAARYGLNPKTVARWRKRITTVGAPMGPAKPRSSALTEAEEGIVVEFRRRSLLPVDVDSGRPTVVVVGERELCRNPSTRSPQSFD